MNGFPRKFRCHVFQMEAFLQKGSCLTSIQKLSKIAETIKGNNLLTEELGSMCLSLELIN